MLGWLDLLNWLLIIIRLVPKCAPNKDGDSDDDIIMLIITTMVVYRVVDDIASVIVIMVVVVVVISLVGWLVVVS